MNTPKPIKKLAFSPGLLNFGRNLMGKARGLISPVRNTLSKSKNVLGGAALAGGAGYLMMQPNRQYPAGPDANTGYGDPMQRSSIGRLDSVFDGPAMAKIPALENPHRAQEYMRVRNQLTQPMFPKTGDIHVANSANRADWATSSDYASSYVGQRFPSKQGQVASINSRRLESKAAAVRDWRQLHDVFTSPPTLEDAGNVANAAIAKQKQRLSAYWPALGIPIGAGALAMLNRKTNFMNKIPSQLSALANRFMKTSKWKKAPVQYNGDVDLSDLARTKKVDSKIPPTGKSTHFFKAGNNPDLLSGYVDTLFSTDSPPNPSLSSAFPKISAFSRGGKGTQTVPVPREPQPYIAATRTLSKAGHTNKFAAKPYDPFAELAAQEEAMMAARPEFNLGEETNPEVEEAPVQPWTGNFGPSAPKPQPQPPGAARAAVQAQLDSGVPPQQAVQTSKAAPAPRSPVQAPATQPAPQTPPAPVQAPGRLPTSVQSTLKLPPSSPPALDPSAFKSPTPKPLSNPFPTSSAPLLAKRVPAPQAAPQAPAQSEDAPFKLPPNLSGVQMQSKDQIAAGQQAVQSLPQEKTQPVPAGHPAPPTEARAGDPAYPSAGSPVQGPNDVGRFYGAIQRHKDLGMDANRKAYLERTSKSRNMSASQRAEAQRELDRINAGGDNNILAGLKKDQLLGAEDHLRSGISPAAVAGWQGNNQTLNGRTVSTRGYWEQDAANQLAKEQGMPTTPNQFAAYVSPRQKGLQGVASTQPVMGQGAGGVSMAQGRPKPMSPTSMPGATGLAGGAQKQTPQLAQGLNNPGLNPPKPPKPGIGSPLGVPGGKAAMYRDKEANIGAMWQGAKNVLKPVGQFLGGSRHVAPAKRWYNNKYVQPVWGAMSGAAQGGAIDSIAGLAGYDTGGTGMMAGAGLGTVARFPGARHLMNRWGRNMGASRSVGNIVHDQFKLTGHRNPILSTLGMPGKSLQSKIQAGLLFGGAGAEAARQMAVNRGREAAYGTANSLAQQFGFDNIRTALMSPGGQFLTGYNQGGLGQGISQGWGALTPAQRYAIGAGLVGMGAGAGTMAFSDNNRAGLGMMGLGGLGVAHGLGAFDGLGQQMQAMMRSRDDMSRNELQYAQG
jgi:hypothetical protein